jgi:hypothetical protein
MASPKKPIVIFGTIIDLDSGYCWVTPQKKNSNDVSRSIDILPNIEFYNYENDSLSISLRVGSILSYFNERVLPNLIVQH